MSEPTPSQQGVMSPSTSLGAFTPDKRQHLRSVLDAAATQGAADLDDIKNGPDVIALDEISDDARERGETGLVRTGTSLDKIAALLKEATGGDADSADDFAHSLARLGEATTEQRLLAEGYRSETYSPLEAARLALGIRSVLNSGTKPQSLSTLADDNMTKADVIELRVLRNALIKPFKDLHSMTENATRNRHVADRLALSAQKMSAYLRAVGHSLEQTHPRDTDTDYDSNDVIKNDFLDASDRLQSDLVRVAQISQSDSWDRDVLDDLLSNVSSCLLGCERIATTLEQQPEMHRAARPEQGRENLQQDFIFRKITLLEPPRKANCRRTGSTGLNSMLPTWPRCVPRQSGGRTLPSIPLARLVTSTWRESGV